MASSWPGSHVGSTGLKPTVQKTSKGSRAISLREQSGCLWKTWWGTCLEFGWGFRRPQEAGWQLLGPRFNLIPPELSCPWYHDRTMLIKSFSLIQPECKLGRNEDK